MKIYLGADHRGFQLKEAMKYWLVSQGLDVEDLGAQTYDKGDDYVDKAYAVAKAVRRNIKSGEVARGVVMCGSGVGVEVVADKVAGVRCGLGFSEDQVKAARLDDDITVLAVASDFIEEQLAKRLIKAFLETPFSNKERHIRRLRKLEELEYNI